jgi:hypothetical protein
MGNTKPIRLSLHAQRQAELRGTTSLEIVETIRTATWQSALRGKQQAKKYFVFDGISPVNQKQYRFKTVEVIFADEAQEIVVITAKVYYSNEEQAV